MRFTNDPSRVRRTFRPARSAAGRQPGCADSPDHGTAVAELEPQTRHARLWHVILLNDDDHSYDYVIEMLGKLFGHSAETAYRMALEVDQTGRVIVTTTSFERAELKRDQIHAYGADRRIERSKGSMSAVIEPAPG